MNMNIKEQLKKADILGFAVVAAALISWSVRSIWTPYQTIAVVLGGLLIVVSVALKAQDIRAGLGRRSTRFGINSATSVVLLVAVLALVNYLGAQHVKRVDMTTEKIYSLSDQSVSVAEQIKDNLTIKAFYPGGDYAPARDLLDLFKSRNSKISVEFIDPDKQPQVAQQYKIAAYGDFQNPMTGESYRYGTLILEMGNKTERVEKQSEPLREEDVTNALVKIVKGEKKTIYFTDGHGEKKLDDMERTGYSGAKMKLETENYTVKTVNLVSEGKVPDDASVIVVAGPTSEPFPNELEFIDAFLNKGGSALIMVDPPPGASLSDFLKKWSVDVGNNIVLDASGVGRLFGAGPSIPLVTTYGKHKITERFNTMTFFPLVRSMKPLMPPVTGITVEELFSSNERSWGETNLKSGDAKFDENVDMKGPVSLAVAVTKDLGENKKVRLVAIGDSDFASNGFLGSQGNGNLFLNTVTWLAQDESFITIRPKNPEDRRLTMTEAQGRLVSYVSVLLLPLSILIAGVSVWMNRRK
jgi:gliding motility-associatede transport system auxiliary component